MKLLSKQIVQSAVVGVVLPALLVAVVMSVSAHQQEAAPTRPGTKVTLPKPDTQPTQPQQPLFLPVLHQGQTVNMDIEEYLVGVLLAEVPASFEAEALKAQAVAARTYALKCHQQGYKHAGAVCTEYACCQGYLSDAEYLERKGTQADVEKIRRAVADTEGQVLVYDGKLIVATYFACSGGSTEDAAAVWGQSYPYLQAVESPGEEDCAYYTHQITLTPEQMCTLLDLSPEQLPGNWIGDISYTVGGGVDTMDICGSLYQGTALRTLLGLRSTAFTVTFSEGVFVFETLGYGHRVGMSQYGADAMAVGGNDYQQILQHYYQGTEIVQYHQTIL